MTPEQETAFDQAMTGIGYERRPTTEATTRNEAAERLLDWVGLTEQPGYDGGNTIYDELRTTLLPDALAAERKITVERIRTAADRRMGNDVLMHRVEFDRILDEEAVR